MKNYIPSLNGLRALSIFFVLYSHVLLKNFHYKENPGGQIGVNIFFVISGYLITLLLLKEENSNGEISLKGFYIRRTIRIFPIYYCLLLVYFILSQAGILHFTNNSWLTSLTYTKYFPIEGGSEWASGHLWSLSVEEHFYLLWPLVFKYFKKYRVMFAIAVIAIVPFIRMGGEFSSMHMFVRGDALMWGCLFAIYNEKIVGYITNSKAIYKLVPFGFLLFCLVFKRATTLLGYSEIEPFVKAFFGSFGSVTNISIGMIILISIYSKDTVWFKFLNLAPLNFIGKLSYSIYLWQQLFFSPDMGKLSAFPYNLVYIFITALVSYYAIEQPFLKLKSRFAKKEKAEPLSVELRPA